MSGKDLYDIIIIGGGPAGYTAAQYASRAERKVLLVEKMVSGGQIAWSDSLANYPGFPEAVGGIEFGQLLEKQARKFGAEILMDQVESVTAQEGVFQVTTSTGVFKCGVVIVASGVTPRILGVPGEEELKGRGVSYCATCDGAFFRDKDVLVVGGGDSALEEAYYLTRFARKVMIVHRRDAFRGIKYLQERAFKNEKITFYLSHVLKAIKGTNKVELVVLEDLARGEEKVVKADGVFMYVGNDPNTGFLKDLPLSLDKQGYIHTNEMMETDIPGLYVVGDVRHKFLRQVVTATSDGAVAAMAAIKYMEDKGD